jgi:DNA replication licensing factor MCM4
VAKFVCERCGSAIWVANEGGKVREPHQCASQHCSAKHAMKLVHNQCLYSDKQLLKIQESPNLIPEGETPHAVTAFVYDALVDFVRPGDRITLVGASVSESFLCMTAATCGIVRGSHNRERHGDIQTGCELSC